MKNDWHADSHTHTRHSPDSDAPMQAMCAAAYDSGLSYLAVTDHVEMQAFLEDGYDRSAAASFAEAGEMRAAWEGRLTVARGMEMGQPLEDPETARALLDTYAFDFVLASLHNLPGDKDFYYYDFNTVAVEEPLDRYFAGLLDMARWGRFHALAHLTYPFRYIPASRRPADLGRWRDTVDEILRTLAQKGLALEINTSGLRQGFGATLPDLPVVRRFRELGGERVTLGSDAHAPVDVGKNLEDGARVAREAGFRYIAAFRGGEPAMMKLD